MISPQVKRDQASTASPLPSEDALTLDPNNPSDRAELLNTHPVRTRAFFIPTPEAVRVCEIIIDTIYRTASCCGFVAYSRYGKSALAKYSESKVREAIPSVPILRWSAKKTEGWDDKKFHRHLLQSTMGYDPARGEDVQVLVRRLWLGVARDAQSTQLVIMCDEVHRLDEAAFDLLLEMTNILEESRVRTTFIYFAGPLIENTRSMLQGARRSEIIQRFLARQSRLEGISSKDVLADFMHAYDELQYPPGSGWSFTRFYLPLAYESGFRLSSCASHLWDAFVGSARKLPKISDSLPFEIGIEQVCDAIQIVLMRGRDSNEYSSDRLIWIQAVAQSSYPDSLT